MKKLYTLFLATSVFAISHLSAQQVTISPADSVSSDVNVSTAFATYDQYIYLTNTHTDSIQIVWRMLSHSDPGWSLQMCDNSNCYPLPGTPKTSLKFAPGEQLDMHALIAPQLMAGSGTLHLGVRIVNDTFPELTLTYHANVAIVSGINNISEESANITLFPNPVSDVITLEGINPTHNNTVQIVDVAGRVLKNETSAINTTFTTSVSNLPAGIYVVKVLNAENKLMAVKKFSKL